MYVQGIYPQIFVQLPRKYRYAVDDKSNKNDDEEEKSESECDDESSTIDEHLTTLYKEAIQILYQRKKEEVLEEVPATEVETAEEHVANDEPNEENLEEPQEENVENSEDADIKAPQPVELRPELTEEEILIEM
eukprot:UN26038